MASKDIGVFTPQQLRRSWASTLHYERTNNVRPDRSVTESIPDHILFRNDSGHEIPAYGCMQMSGTVEEGYGNYITIERPIQWTAAVVGPFLFNSDRAVPDGEFGVAQFGPVFRVISDGTSLPVGVRVGPITSTFTVGKGCLYSVIGADDVATNCIRIVSCETPLLAVATTGISAGGSATVTAKVPSATTWSGGSVTYTARNDSGTAIPSAATVILFPVDAKWLAVEIC